MKKQTFIQGGLILAAMGFISKFVGLFFRFPMTSMIGDEGMGFYQLTFPIFGIFIAIASGVPIALSKLISENNDTGKEADNIALVKISTMILFILAVISAVMIFFIKDFLIVKNNWDPRVIYCIIAISVAPIFISVVNPIRGYFQGYKNMNATAISQFLEQVGRVVFGVGLGALFLSKGIEFAAAGAVIGVSIGGAIASIYLVVKLIRVRPKNIKKAITPNKKLVFIIIKTAAPIAVGAVIVSILGFLDSILIPKQLALAGFSQTEATVLFSQFTGKAMTLTHIPLTLSIAIGSALVPAIASSNTLNKGRELSNNIGMSFKACFVIGLPCTLGLFFLAEPIMATLFPGNEGGAEILRYLSLTIPFLVMSQITTAILQGLGHMKTPLITTLFGAVVKLVLTFTLIPIRNINIEGAVIASITCYALMAILNIICLKFYTNFKVKWREILFKPLLASLIMTIVALGSFLVLIDITKIVSITCLIAIGLGGLIYVILAFVLKIFSYDYMMDKAKDKLGKKIA
ncbi:MAG: putative polysaccharide biosynthesis protein [Sarcina sp.]